MAKGYYTLEVPAPGTKLFNLTVQESTPISSQKGRLIEVMCDCGKLKYIDLSGFVRGRIKSCGCYLRHNALLIRNKKHGLSYHATYTSWRCMIERCRNPKTYSWQYYGGRGIKVCDSWKNFSNFKNDMGQRPAGASLDRIDVNGDYCKENCRWATIEQQFSNTRRSRHVTLNGERLTVSQWARRCGLSAGTLWARLNTGWTAEEALTLPLRQGSRKPLLGVKKQLDAIVRGKKKKGNKWKT